MNRNARGYGITVSPGGIVADHFRKAVEVKMAAGAKATGGRVSA